MENKFLSKANSMPNDMARIKSLKTEQLLNETESNIRQNMLISRNKIHHFDKNDFYTTKINKMCFPLLVKIIATIMFISASSVYLGNVYF